MLRVLWRLILFGSLFFLADYGGSLLLRYGLDRYYGLAEKAPILCVGHSRMVSGIDEAMLEERTGCAVAKYAVQGTCLEDHCIMIRQYLERYPGSGKILLYIVDDYTFGKSLGKNAYRLFYPFMDAACVAGYLRRESGSWQEYTARAWLRLLRFSDTTVQSIARMGLLGRKELAEEQEVSLADLREKLAVLRLDEQRRVLPENLERFNRLVQLARSEGMTLVLLYLPFIDLLDEEGSGEASATLPIFRRYAAGDPGIRLIELDPSWRHRHELFADATHPNRAGQIYITRQIAADLAALQP